MKKLLLTFALTLPLVSFTQELSEELQTQIKQTQQEFQIPAIAVSLITPDSIFSFVNGKVQLGKKERIAKDAKFHLGSNTKAITSFLAKRMAEQKQIDFNSRFFDFFPELEADAQPEYLQMTLGTLLSHQAQIPPYTKGAELAKFQKLKGTASENRYAFAKDILSDKPVTKGTYSNADYVLATLMLEKVSGKSYRELIEDLMDDLDLNYFVGFPNKENTSFPWGHWQENGSLSALPPSHFYKLPNFMSSAGDLSMNLQDYSAFVQLNLQGLNGKSNYLTAEAYDDLHFGQNSYAYGWGNVQKQDYRVSYHDGSAGTYYCHTFLIPDKQLAVVILMNTASAEAIKAIYTLREWMTANPKQSKNN